MPKLFAARYDDPSYSGTNIAESFEEISDLGIRWSLPGGIQRIELTIKARSRIDAYQRYQNHLGHRIAIYDSFVDRCIGGQVYEIIPDGQHVKYICAGPWKRIGDDEYTRTDMGDLTIPTDETDVVVQDILDDSVTVTASDQSNIAGSGIDIGGWSPDAGGLETQLSASAAITELSLMGDSSYNPMDFYLVDQPFNGTQMQKPLPYFKSRSTTASPDWQFYRSDLVSGGATLGRNIWNLIRSAKLYFSRLTGTHDGAGNSTVLIDSTADFRSRVSPGDRVLNITDNRFMIVDAVDSQTQISFVPSTFAIDWDGGDIYMVLIDSSYINNTYTSSETDLWTTVYNETRPEMDQTQAQTYARQLLALYEKPVQQQSFILGSRTIQDRNGAEWPLWRPLMGDSFYFRIDDLFPEAALLSTSDDRSQAFMAVAMDYTFADNKLRVVPSTGDSRLDVILNQAGLVNGQIISTAEELAPAAAASRAAYAAQQARLDRYRERHQQHMDAKHWDFFYRGYQRKGLSDEMASRMADAVMNRRRIRRERWGRGA